MNTLVALVGLVAVLITILSFSKRAAANAPRAGARPTPTDLADAAMGEANVRPSPGQAAQAQAAIAGAGAGDTPGGIDLSVAPMSNEALQTPSTKHVTIVAAPFGTPQSAVGTQLDAVVGPDGRALPPTSAPEISRLETSDGGALVTYADGLLVGYAPAIAPVAPPTSVITKAPPAPLATIHSDLAQRFAATAAELGYAIPFYEGGQFIAYPDGRIARVS